MKVPYSIISNSEEETASLAAKFADSIKTGDIVALNGNLGTGKTFFVKKFCEKYGIDAADSPTFSIVNEYRGAVLIYHFDFYRIKKIEELFDIGIEEYLMNEEAIKLIEWAELMLEVIPRNHYEIKFNYLSENSRQIEMKYNE